MIKVKADHIAPGIAKYGGEVDKHINALLTAAGYQYTAYRFKDGRILLVLPGYLAAFLYSSEKVLFDKLSLT